MVLNALGYQSHPPKRCHPDCGYQGSSHLSPILAHDFFIAILLKLLVQHVHLVNNWLNFTYSKFSRFPLRPSLVGPELRSQNFGLVK